MGGGEFNFPYHYKQKEFTNSGKVKSSEWFSKRVNTYIPAVFAGVNFPGGFNVKFTWMLDDFMNKDYALKKDGQISYPYENMKSQIYYLSINWLTTWGKNGMSVKDVTKQKQVAVL